MKTINMPAGLKC